VVIAIDGPAGSGKSAIARMVGDRTGFLYINSGSLYRAVTCMVLKSGCDPNDVDAVVSAAQSTEIILTDQGVVLDGRSITENELHSDDVDLWVAKHSSIREVREIVNEHLRRNAENRNVVVEGRDITTVVFPDADVKIYLDANINSRAERRYRQGTSAMTLEDIRESIRRRDEQDMAKSYGSLKVSPDAVYLDTSDLTIESVYEKVIEIIQRTQTNLQEK
jgi:cytidylate kinase